jgi:signal transduction histidine kinase
MSPQSPELEHLSRRQRALGARWLLVTLSVPLAAVALAALVTSDRPSVAVPRYLLAALIGLLAAALVGLLALARSSRRAQEESALVTQRLTRMSRALGPLSAALEDDPTAVLLLDESGAVVYSNASCKRLLGGTAPLVGRSVSDVLSGLPRELQEALDSGQDSLLAMASGTRDAEDETLLVSSRSLTIDGREHFLYMLRPVTRQVRRQELEYWRKLIRVLSHELNNSLAPITSLVSSARRVNELRCKDEKLEEIFGAMAERTSRLLAFLESYRDLARLPRPMPSEVPWQSFLEGVAAQQPFNLLGRLPERPGWFDPIQLERVLLNLLRNAREAGSPPEAIDVSVQDDGDRVRIEVLDRGTGMPDTVFKQALLPFFSTKPTGTGVGLALSREVIEAHGGDLLLANREGGGLCVSCSLPAAPAPASRGSLTRLTTLA